MSKEREQCLRAPRVEIQLSPEESILDLDDIGDVLERKPIVVSRRGSIDLSVATLVSNKLGNTIAKSIADKRYHKMMKKLRTDTFTSKKLPKMSVADFVSQAQYKTRCEDMTLVTAMILLKRYTETARILLTNMNVYKLFYTALIVAVKNVEDRFYYNKYYAKTLSMTLEEFNALERAFLEAIQFSCFVSQEEFEEYYAALREQDICY